MTFQSEIRPSQINELIEKVQKGGYNKYINKIVIEKARNFRSQVITFDFPVTAIVGPNGGGKTTILGAAACAYKSVKPSLYFAKSGAFDASMQNWRFEYDLIDRSLKQKDSVRRSAKFTNYKWSRDGLSRDVVVFGVSRTVPANERPELRRCISGKFSVASENIASIADEVSIAVGRILDKDISDFKFATIDSRGKVKLLAGSTQDGDAYSEFHFGAGESSVIRMAMALESVPENSLVIIEEIENGLHPVATVRMVEYLIELAIRRKIQAIFSTHSDNALLPLPDKAIWAVVNGVLYQGKLDISSLRSIAGQIEARLVIFVEDRFSEIWVKEIIRHGSNIALDAINIAPMGGDGLAATVHKNRRRDPTMEQPSLCIVDGDSSTEEDTENDIYKLPGQSPEGFIFNQVVDILDSVSGVLSVSLLQPYEAEENIKDIIRSVQKTNRDPHLLYSQVGGKLGFLPEDRVREAFVHVWAAHNEVAIDGILRKFANKLPKDRAKAN